MEGTEMTIPPLQPPKPNAQYQYRPVAPIAPQTNFEPPMKQAPTLGQFWRSDVRTLPGHKRPRWAGRLSFWLGLVAAVLLIGGSLFALGAWTAEVALALGVVAGFFGLVALIAGIGRAAGFFGIILALIGNMYVLSWLGQNVF
jgi:hypothetical protein